MTKSVTKTKKKAQYKSSSRLFSGGSDGKKSACNEGDLSLIPGLGRYPGVKQGNALQYSYLANSHGQRSLGSYIAWGGKKLNMTEQLITGQQSTILWSRRKTYHLNLS